MFHLVALSIIIGAALVLFIGGWISVDLVGLLVLCSLAITGLVTSADALAGFSSSAVITILGMFILSAGLTRTGVAYWLGKPLQRLTRAGEPLLVVGLMVTASLLSALINTTTVATILLPVVMDLARRSQRSPSRLMMPLAAAAVLGGPFTSISTATNILASDALRSAGIAPFALFDFTPITAIIVVFGIGFMVSGGLRLLPNRKAQASGSIHSSIKTAYQLDTHIGTIRIHPGSLLAGRTLIETRLGSALYLTVVAIQRRGRLILSPRPDEILQIGDTLVVHGSREYLQRFDGAHHIQIEPSCPADDLFAQGLLVAEGVVAKGSPLIDQTLAESELRSRFRVHLLSLVNPGQDSVPSDLRWRKFAENDRLVLQGERASLEELGRQGLISDLRFLEREEIQSLAADCSHRLLVCVPPGSVLTGHSLIEARLGSAFGLTVVAIRRGENLLFLPQPQETIEANDLLILQGSERDLDIFKALQELQIAEQTASLAAELESNQIGITEVLLSPRTTLVGKTMTELLFREHYGLNVLAIWRKGQVYRKGLQDMPLQYGDALLVYGQRQNLESVGQNPDFLVLDRAALQAPRLDKAPAAVIIMLGVLLGATFGLVPIAIAALTGSALMVLFGCLSMDEAYRAIEWKVIFLIACMLPLGIAVQHTGAAQMGADALLSLIGHLGPRWIMAAIFLITVIGNQVIQPAALVVLMAPVALSIAKTMGLSPHLLMMTVAMAAATCYASPLSHPANLLVMGPGGYRFIDYLKVGIPLTLMAMALCLWLLPIFWPA